MHSLYSIRTSMSVPFVIVLQFIVIMLTMAAQTLLTLFYLRLFVFFVSKDISKNIWKFHLFNISMYFLNQVCLLTCSLVSDYD